MYSVASHPSENVRKTTIIQCTPIIPSHTGTDVCTTEWTSHMQRLPDTIRTPSPCAAHNWSARCCRPRSRTRPSQQARRLEGETGPPRYRKRRRQKPGGNATTARKSKLAALHQHPSFPGDPGPHLARRPRSKPRRQTQQPVRSQRQRQRPTASERYPTTA